MIQQMDMFDSSPHSRHIVRVNSRLAYHSERDAGHLGDRARACLAVIRAAVAPVTDRDVAVALGFSDMNSVRPRITELIEAGVVSEHSTVRCPVTGKMVRTLAAHGRLT